MQVIQRLSQPLYDQTESDETSPLSHQEKLQQTHKAQAELSKIDQQLSGLVEGTASARVLAMIAAHQKQVVMAMLGANPEMTIAGILAQGIEQYGSKLEELQAWTNGGEEMFEEALQFMLEDLLSGGLSDKELEDALLLLVMDLQVNGSNYGLDDFLNTPEIQEFMLFIVELIGSGNHAIATDGNSLDWDTPNDIADNIKDFLNGLSTAIDNSGGDIPSDSVLAKVLDELEGKIDQLCNYFVDHFDDAYGNISETDELCPVFKLYLLFNIASEVELTQADVELILSGSRGELDAFFNEKVSSDAIDYMCENSSWEQSPEDWGEPFIFIPGGSVTQEEIDNLCQTFTGRELTEDEVKEINRIGDQVRMLQETLKYWLSIIRDGQLQTARNI